MFALAAEREHRARAEKSISDVAALYRKADWFRDRARNIPPEMLDTWEQALAQVRWTAEIVGAGAIDEDTRKSVARLLADLKREEERVRARARQHRAGQPDRSIRPNASPSENRIHEPTEPPKTRSELMRPRNLFRSLALGLIVFGGGSPPAWSSPDSPYLVLQTGPEESVTSVALSPDGSLVASGSFDGGVRIYDAHTGVLRRVIGSEPSRGVRAIAFSADGTMIASGGLEMDKTLKLWNVRTGGARSGVRRT